MRLLKAGILLLILWPAIVAAEVSGTVESIGFANVFRPDAWTPMVITVTPDGMETREYQVRVKLQDLDRDLPIYERVITVTGNAEGQNRTYRFRMYFIPPPTDHGLPDAGDAGSLKELQDRLKVSLYTNPGKGKEAKWVCDLPITTTLQNMEPTGDAFNQRRGRKLIVAVTDTNQRLTYEDPRAIEILGVTEDVWAPSVQPRELPESVLGYDAVDAIVWFDADPSELKASGDDKFRALEQYVRRGGRLIICQPTEWQKTLGFGDLLPVAIQDVKEKDDLDPLREMAKPRTGPQESYLRFDTIPDELLDPFNRLVVPPPYRFVRARAKADAVVDKQFEISWPDTAEKSPYIVRRPYGLGSVTWVAQNLGDPALARTKFGWLFVWDKVFGWKNAPLPVNANTEGPVRQRFEQGSPIDVGPALIGGWMDLQSKSAWLITLAVLFFIGYWLIAGPGAFAYLASRRKTQLSWFVFGACAFGATAITYAMYRLVLRGPPDLKHLSFVRVAPNEPAVVISRFGLYIPQDGPKKIQLKDAAPQAVTALSAFPIHPAFLKDVPPETGSEYTVPIIDATSPEPAAITFQYKSTLKKFQATWVGEIKGRIEGSGKLLDAQWIEGNLTNATGKQLRNIFIAFNHPGSVIGSTPGDWLLYIPRWDPGVTYDLNKEFNKGADGKTPPTAIGIARDAPNPNNDTRFRGILRDDQWLSYFTSGLQRTGIGVDTYSDAGEVRKSFIILSLFDRLSIQPNQNPYGGGVPLGRGGFAASRYDFLRRGGRMLDLSQSLAAGALIVMAEANGPIPIPMEVDGDPVTGDGLSFYQFVLPLDHSSLGSTTQPSEDATTQPLETQTLILQPLENR